MKYNFRSDGIPDWVGNAVVTLILAGLSFAFMWGSLKSEVSAQVTAQATDASDIKQLISSQARMEAAVDSLTKDLHLFMYRNSGTNNLPTMSHSRTGE